LNCRVIRAASRINGVAKFRGSGRFNRDRNGSQLGMQTIYCSILRPLGSKYYSQDLRSPRRIHSDVHTTKTSVMTSSIMPRFPCEYCGDSERKGDILTKKPGLQNSSCWNDSPTNVPCHRHTSWFRSEQLYGEPKQGYSSWHQTNLKTAHFGKIKE
jgi:hypothetical protein